MGLLPPTRGRAPRGGRSREGEVDNSRRFVALRAWSDLLLCVATWLKGGRQRRAWGSSVGGVDGERGRGQYPTGTARVLLNPLLGSTNQLAQIIRARRSLRGDRGPQRRRVAPCERPRRRCSRRLLLNPLAEGDRIEATDSVSAGRIPGDAGSRRGSAGASAIAALGRRGDPRSPAAPQDGSSDWRAAAACAGRDRGGTGRNVVPVAQSDAPCDRFVGTFSCLRQLILTPGWSRSRGQSRSENF